MKQALLQGIPTILMMAAPTAQAAEVNAPGWYYAIEGDSCDTECASKGLVCTEQEFRAHHGEIDSDAKVGALLSDLANISCSYTLTIYPLVSGENLTELWENYKYYSEDDVYAVPWTVEYYDDTEDVVCLHGGSNRHESTYDCAAIPWEGDSRRLCYCHTTPETSGTTTRAMEITTESDVNTESEIDAETPTPHTSVDSSTTEMVVESNGAACASVASIAIVMAASLAL